MMELRPFNVGTKGTFAHYTARQRWPTILQNCVEDIKGKSRDGRVTDELVRLKQEVERGDPLKRFTDEVKSKGFVSQRFDDWLGDQTWHDADWLMCEIYLYARIVAIFKTNKGWEDYDIFEKCKRDTFRKSEEAVIELAVWFQRLGDLGSLSEENLRQLFDKSIEISLWGNETDLSLYTNLSADNIKDIQRGAARSSSRSRILINDTCAVWNLLRQFKAKRIDFVLDNSGFELYTDLILVLFLLGTGLTSKCVLHAKCTPYMVSDTMVKDFYQVLADLHDPAFFIYNGTGDHEVKKARAALDYVSDQLRIAIAYGKLEIREHPFWTEPSTYWELVPGHEVYEDLKNSDLIIFKGDLNYRRLTCDLTWPRETEWKRAIGTLALHGLHTLSLRVCKSDVVVGLPPGVDKQLCESWEREQKKHGSWWASSGKWAVICYSDGNPQ